MNRTVQTSNTVSCRLCCRHPGRVGQRTAYVSWLRTLWISSFAACTAVHYLKNRTSQPKDKDIKPQITLAALLASGKDANRWSDNSAAEIEGWVFDVKPGGVESVNCGASDLAGRDTHIEIVANLDDGGPTKRLIIEVTPRVRAMAATKGQDWSTEALLGLKGHRVKITGWMLFDFEHVDESENTAPRKRDNWRATAWEIHPVTRISVVK
jgi:hypothetical protein